MRDDERDPCPTPLSWQQVLAEFQTESTRWECTRDDSLLRGYTWGDGPPIYFLNGLCTTAELFALTVWLLRDEFRCVVYDGFPEARRSGGARKPSIEDGVADLFAAADRNEDDAFFVYAPSAASVTALTAAREAPWRVERLILQNGFADRRWSWMERGLVRLALGCPGTLGRVPGWQTVQRYNHLRWFPPFDRGRWEFYLQTASGRSIRDVAGRASAVMRGGVRRGLAEISQPVLLLRTEGEGRVSAACSDLLEAELPNARREILASCGCLPFLTHPHRLAKVVGAFFQEDTGGGRRDGEVRAEAQASILPCPAS